MADFSRVCTSYIQAEGRKGINSIPVYHSSASSSAAPYVHQLDAIVAQLGALCLDEGFVSSPRGMKIAELTNCSFRLENPRNRVVTLLERKISPKYLAAEFLWYLSADNRAATIIHYAPFWKNLVDEHGTVNSNYGYHIFGVRTSSGNSQWDDVVSELVRDPDSRRAIINIHTPANSRTNPKDVPCTICLQFLVRDRKLQLHVYMRSNDLVRGFCNDVFQFTMLQELLLRELRQYPVQFDGLELGSYTHTTGSMHVYSEHFDQVRAYDANKQLPSVKHLAVMDPMYFMGNLTDLREDLVFVENAGRVIGTPFSEELKRYAELSRSSTVASNLDPGSYWNYFFTNFLDYKGDKS